MSVFNYQKDNDGIVTITMDMTGPVNAMNAEYNVAMAQTLDKLEAEKELKGVIFASAKSTFFAGGDLNMLLKFQVGDEQLVFESTEQGKAWLRRLEKLPVPVVAAINGAALGGGYEICLSCNHRIAWDDRSVEVGLPEVSLGLLPGAGGIVRLTSLLGLEKALPYLLEGKRLKANKALAAGLIDETVSDLEALLPRARAWILANSDAALQPWDQKGFKIPGGNMMNPKLAQTVMMIPSMLLKKTRGLLPAPGKIAEVATETLRVDFDTALRVESRRFVELVTSNVAKNMITTFFFQMNKVNGGASRPANVEPTAVKKLGVIGAGMMGQGIANVSAMAGMNVVLKDVSLEAANKGKDYTAKLLDKAISRGRADEAKKAAVLALIKPTDNDADLAGCDLIIEAVFESVELKQKVTQATEVQLAEGGVWGTNTSTLPITLLSEASAKPENYIGIHFFSPVDKMPLVEIICGDKTSDETLAKAFDYVRQIRKTPIVVNDVVGFYTSRTISTQAMEAAQMVAEGCHPVRVDSLGRAVGMPVGQLTLLDEISLRLSLEVRDTQANMGLSDPAANPTPEAIAMLEFMSKEHNRGGRHHGDGGFYDWNGSEKTIWPPLLEHYYKPEFEISDEDIKDRLLFRPVIETLKCLEEGVLRSVPDANIGSVMGIGAPVWTGGYVQFVNTYGLPQFIKRCDELAAKYGDRFKAPAIVAKKIEQGEQFK